MILHLFFLLSILIGSPDSTGLMLRNDCENIEIKDNRIFVDIKDSGATNRFSIDFCKTESSFQKTAMSGESVKVNNSFFSDIAIPRRPNGGDWCETHGTVGYEFFRKSKQIFMFDFDELTLCNLNSQTLSSYLDQNYVPIEGEFCKDGLYIIVSIKWKRYKVKFDTGYTGSLFINTAEATPFIKEASKDYITIDGKLSVYPNKWVTIGKNYYNSTIQVSENGDSRIGMGFIKGFNWIIDFKKHKIYLKKNSVSLDSQNIFPSEYAASLIDGRLTISSKFEKANRFGLGDVITSVNGAAVTDENVCEIQALLHRTKNWDDLQIEITRK